MSEPTLSDFLIRVGGVFAVFTIAVLLTTQFFPGYEGYVVIAIGVVGLCLLTLMEVLKKNQANRRNKLTLFNFLIRVGGVLVVFAIPILLTTRFFPGYESHVVIAMGVAGLCLLALMEILEKKRSNPKRKSNRKNR